MVFNRLKNIKRPREFTYLHNMYAKIMNEFPLKRMIILLFLLLKLFYC